MGGKRERGGKRKGGTNLRLFFSWEKVDYTFPAQQAVSPPVQVCFFNRQFQTIFLSVQGIHATRSRPCKISMVRQNVHPSACKGHGDRWKEREGGKEGQPLACFSWFLARGGKREEEEESYAIFLPLFPYRRRRRRRRKEVVLPGGKQVISRPTNRAKKQS